MSAVTAHIGRSTGRYILPFLLLELIVADQLVDLPPSIVVKNGSMRFLLLESSYWQITWQIYPPWVEASSGQEWQYEMSAVTAHIGRSTGRYILPFLLLELIVADQLVDLTPHERHVVVENGNMRFLLLELIVADQLVDIYHHFYC